MKQSEKAVLWTLAVPGAGHFYLKRFQRGLIFLVPSLICVVLYVRDAILQVVSILDKIQRGVLDPDLFALLDTLDKLEESPVANISFWVFMLCLVVAAVDAYLLSEQIAKNAKNAVNAQKTST